MHVYDAITDALTDLDGWRYNLDFNLTAEGLICKSVNLF
jgi:hypothetical protein